jgi:ElaB/YqjD/DUF883 family membrane-anchored ribosome-binding protein
MGSKSEAARDALAQAADRASDAGRRLVELASAMQEKAEDSLRTTRRRSQDYSGRLRECVTDYPLASVGIALAVGALVTVLLSRK